jgi:enoyl-CoA hydratase/carnithine racemase
LADWTGSLASFPKLTFAAIEGFALGAGLQLAMCCDVIVVHPEARIFSPDIARGVVPGCGGVQRYTRRLNKSRVNEFLLTAKHYNGLTAVENGLADIADERPVDRALSLATTAA